MHPILAEVNLIAVPVAVVLGSLCALVVAGIIIQYHKDKKVLTTAQQAVRDCRFGMALQIFKKVARTNFQNHLVSTFDTAVHGMQDVYRRANVRCDLTPLRELRRDFVTVRTNRKYQKKLSPGSLTNEAQMISQKIVKSAEAIFDQLPDL